jgi:hypothetical protein
MNVSGPGNSIPAAYRIPPVARPPTVQPAVEVGKKTPAVASSDEAVAPGSDPALWSILTSEERAFFARQAALGPLHYGPGARSTPPVSDGPLGGRIDVRG